LRNLIGFGIRAERPIDQEKIREFENVMIDKLERNKNLIKELDEENMNLSLMVYYFFFFDFYKFF